MIPALALLFVPLLQEPDVPVVEPPEPPPTVEEEETGYLFPAWIYAPRGEERIKMHLVATGVREKTIFRVNVYGFAMYLNLDEAMPHLRQAARGLSEKKAVKSKEFQRSLLSDAFGKSMRWEMARNVEAEDIREAFEDILEPRIEDYTEDDPEAREAARAALRQFRSFFERPVEKHDILVFHWEPGGRLHTVIAGEDMAVIENVWLCRAIFDVYFGPDADMTSFRKDFIRNLWRQLQAHFEREASR